MFEYIIDTNNWEFVLEHIGECSFEHLGKITNYGVEFDSYAVTTAEKIDGILDYYMVDYNKEN